MGETVTDAVGGAVASMVDANEEFSRFFRDEFPAVVRTTFLILHDRERGAHRRRASGLELDTRRMARRHSPALMGI